MISHISPDITICNIAVSVRWFCLLFWWCIWITILNYRKGMTVVKDLTCIWTGDEQVPGMVLWSKKRHSLVQICWCNHVVSFFTAGWLPEGCSTILSDSCFLHRCCCDIPKPVDPSTFSGRKTWLWFGGEVPSQKVFGSIGYDILNSILILKLGLRCTHFILHISFAKHSNYLIESIVGFHCIFCRATSMMTLQDSWKTTIP